MILTTVAPVSTSFITFIPYILSFLLLLLNAIQFIINRKDKSSAERKSRISELEKENQALKLIISELSNYDNIEKSLIRHNDSYVTLPSNNGLNIHYCAACWGNNRKLNQVRIMANRSLYNCAICNNSGHFDPHDIT